MFSWCLRGLLTLAIVVPAVSQELFDTTFVTRYFQYINIPVTYFDYHDDNSTYDFGTMAEQRFNSSGLPWDTNLKGWADSTLTAAKLPRRAPSITDPTTSLSYNIEKLFTPWVSGVVDSFTKKGDSIYPLIDSVRLFYVIGIDTIWYMDYKYDTVKIATPDTIVKSDTLFKNIAVPDTLQFTRGLNTYTADTADSMWQGGDMTGSTAMNGKGFLEDPNGCWTVSLHNKFTYHGGEVLHLGADDDFYLFINGKLAGEGGGFHAIILDTIYLDSLHLTVGQKYDFDVFVANRRHNGGLYMDGITDFEIARRGTDTLHDTILTPIVAVSYHNKKAIATRSVLGIPVAAGASKVTIEAFSLAGKKIVTREMPVDRAVAMRSLVPTRSMAIIRVSFYNAYGACIATGSRRLAPDRK